MEKATGIIRKLDDLGRFVVPVELRNTLLIAPGDPLEVFTDDEGRIILRKYEHDAAIRSALSVLERQIENTDDLQEKKERLFALLNEVANLLDEKPSPSIASDCN